MPEIKENTINSLQIEDKEKGDIIAYPKVDRSLIYPREFGKRRKTKTKTKKPTREILLKLLITNQTLKKVAEILDIHTITLQTWLHQESISRGDWKR